jgi:hypothetical protein
MRGWVWHSSAILSASYNLQSILHNVTLCTRPTHHSRLWIAEYALNYTYKYERPMNSEPMWEVRRNTTENCGQAHEDRTKKVKRFRNKHLTQTKQRHRYSDLLANVNKHG